MSAAPKPTNDPVLEHLGETPVSLPPRQKLYVVLCSCFVASLLLGDITGAKYFALPGGGPLSVGMVPFPLTFVLTDVINEFYGKHGARFITLVAAGMAVYAFLFLQLALVLPHANESPISAEHFVATFGLSASWFQGSLLAFLVSQFVDVYAFQFFKRVTRAKHLWLRATGSTALSQIVDTVVVNFQVLGGRMPFDDIVGVIVRSYATKVLIAVALTPLVYMLHGVVIRVFAMKPVFGPKEPEVAA